MNIVTRTLCRLLLAALLSSALCQSATAAIFTAAERVRETTTTTGTGTYTLAGAPTGYKPVSSVGANNYMPYFITDGTNWEVGIGQYLSGPDRLTRDFVVDSSNAGAAVSWGTGTRTIRSGWPAWLGLPRYLSKSVAGGAGTTVLTQREQRRRVIEFNGALTGNRTVEVDATEWDWIVYNNTTGAFTLTLKVTGQTGVVLPQGVRSLVYSDGTDVRLAADLSLLTSTRSANTFLAGPASGAAALPTWRTPVGADGASKVLLAIYTPSAAASVDITSVLSSTYDTYEIEVQHLVPVTDAVSLFVRFDTSNGASFDAGATDYIVASRGLNSGGTSEDASSGGTTAIRVSGGTTGIGNTASLGGLNGLIRVCNVNTTSGQKHLEFTTSYYTTGGALISMNGAGASNSATLRDAAVNAVQLLMSSGNISSGTIRVWGIRKS
jgi:hypothetical protein